MTLPTTQEELDKLLEETVGRKIKGLTKQLEDRDRQIQERDAKLGEFNSADAKRREAEQEAARKRLEEQGQFGQLKADLERQLGEKDKHIAERDEKIKALTERETARLERVSQGNKRRIEALPKELRVLVPEGLGADDAAEQIARIEALSKTERVIVHGGGGRTEPPQTDEDKKRAHADEIAKKAREFILGPSKKDK